jgi:hypothetical protein
MSILLLKSNHTKWRLVPNDRRQQYIYTAIGGYLGLLWQYFHTRSTLNFEGSLERGRSTL